MAAIGITALGCTIAYTALTLKLSPVYAQVGPKLFPLLIGIGMGIIGLGFLGEILITERHKRPSIPKVDFFPILIILTALAGYILLIERLGYIVSTTLYFICIASAFFDRSWLKNLIIGFLLATCIFFAFTRTLDLVLPTGRWFEVIWP